MTDRVEYVVGMDGGGTKTAVDIADLKGKIRNTFRAGAINYNGESEQNIAKNFDCIFETIFSLGYCIENCRGVCIGTAGISNPSVKERVIHQVREHGYHGNVCAAGDHETALAGALGKAQGIILIAGTGSICYGKNQQGKEHRTGGFGYLFDDEGSGYAIGRDILSAVVRAYDGRMEKTVLTELVFEKLNVLTVEELIGVIYKGAVNKRNIAALSPLLIPACDACDAAAENIVDKCSMELLKLVQPVAEMLEIKSGELAAAGSILQKDPYISASFIKKLKKSYPEFICTEPRQDAAYGAVMMALDCAGLSCFA